MRVGEALAEARGRAGLTVAEVSQRTRIREPVIRGIEGDDYSACGGDFYARGNIRSIAKAVGTDPEPLICEYDAVHRAPGVLSAVSLDELLTRGQEPGRHRRSWTVVLGLALIAALGFMGYRFLAGPPDAASTPPAAAGHPAAANHAAAAGHAAATNHAVTNAGRRGAILTEPRRPALPEPSRPAPSRHLLAPVSKPMRPPDTVRAYVAAINGHHYARAWRLGGRNFSGSYASFVSGFAGTDKDTLAIVSVSGDVVTARLSAGQTDGTVDTYQGTYTVHHGIIIGADVVHVS